MPHNDLVSEPLRSDCQLPDAWGGEARSSATQSRKYLFSSLATTKTWNCRARGGEGALMRADLKKIGQRFSRLSASDVAKRRLAADAAAAPTA